MFKILVLATLAARALSQTNSAFTTALPETGGGSTASAGDLAALPACAVSSGSQELVLSLTFDSKHAWEIRPPAKAAVLAKISNAFAIITTTSTSFHAALLHNVTQMTSSVLNVYTNIHIQDADDLYSGRSLQYRPLYQRQRHPPQLSRMFQRGKRRLWKFIITLVQ